MSFKITKESLNIPWIMSPFFWTLLSNDKTISSVEKSLCMKFVTEGYIMVDLELSNKNITSIVNDMLSLSKANPTVQDQRYHYSDGPRIFEGWKTSKNIADLARHPKILKTLRLLYNKSSRPFQTINFLKGSNQPMHSDTIHFNTVPQGWVAGVWVALEDMDLDNGTLLVCPGSHTSIEFDFDTLQLDIHNIDKDFNNYSVYEEFIKSVIIYSRYNQVPIVCKRGTAVIWASNLLHGGASIKDHTRTRYSQATHYFFPDCEHYYYPLFSEPYKNIYAEKDLQNKNILDYG